MPPPTVALVGATGLVGSALLPAFVQALKDHQFASLRILTASPSSPALSLAHSVPGVEIIEISFGDQRGLAEALRGVEVLVSAMGAAETKQGKYQGNKQKLLDAAVEAGVKVYVPSEWGTDWRGENQELVHSPMFDNKKKHLEEARARGLYVLAVHNGLILEISFSDWLGIPATSSAPTWTIPSPSHPVAFTSLADLGPYTLSAILQTLSSAASPIPSHLRLYSDSVTLEQAADVWEKLTGGTVTRVYQKTEELKERYEEQKPTLASGMLGTAIPLMISTAGGFDHTGDNVNALLNSGAHAFKPKTVEGFLREKAEELKRET